MHNSDVVDFIENMAQEQLRYDTIFGEQAEVLRADIPRFEAAMAQIQQLLLVAKQWEPAQDNVDEYLAHCNDICCLVPQDFDDRVKILHGAHAALMCLGACKIARQPDSVQLAILKRHNELAPSVCPTRYTPSSHLITANNRELPPSKPSVESKHITAEELQLFQNPDNLLGKQFILSPDTDDESGMYEVIGYHVKRDKTVQYDVLFDDCQGDAITVDVMEMMGMLEDSLYLQA